MNNFEIGQRIFNRGDMANIEHFGTITKIIKSKFRDSVEITPDKGSERKYSYIVGMNSISDIDNGNGSTRIVTIEAYNKRRNEQIKKSIEYINSLKNK